MTSVTFPAFLYEFRNIKLECLMNELRKMTPEELERIKAEIEFLLLNLTEEKETHV